MFSALKKSVLQLFDKRVRKVLLQAFACTAVIYAALFWLLWKFLAETELFSTGWLESMSDFLGGALVFILSLIFFPSIAIVVIGLFLEQIITAVEAKHYPDLPAPRAQPIMETIISTVKFALSAILINIIMLPFLLIPFLNLIIFYSFNGYLFSREYFELIASRRINSKTTKKLRKKHRFYLLSGGVIIVFLMTIPFINIIAPIIATAFMVHLFEKLSHKSKTTSKTSP